MSYEDPVVYWPSKDEYDPGITKEEWMNLLQDSEVTLQENLVMLKMMLEFGGESTCANLAETFGGSAFSYNAQGRAFGDRVYRSTGCPLVDDGGTTRRFTIPFVGRTVFENGKRRYSWKMRDELMEALETMDLSSVDIHEAYMKKEKETFDKNVILYGPPGTGKTYNTAIYAVAVCDGKSPEELTDYDKVMARFKELKEVHRVEFTTFHQSYGYEEFIEGIKPVVDSDKAEVSYSIEAGVFKRFCEQARIPSGITADPDAAIWFMMLGSSLVVNLKEKCLERNEVIVSIESGDTWTQERFIDFMQIGDYILSYAGNSLYIDAIGVIESEPELIESGEAKRWRRAVKWYRLPKKTNVKAINSDKYLPNFSIARMNHMKVSDLLSLLPQEISVEEDRPYVFIIDEINRGNISKIFGELITLIEDTKREGMPELASATLPYSGESFSIPSNVYILGTMNTADRSIALMDTALRRRFSFIEMMPDTNVLREIGADEVRDGNDTLDVAAMLETINERIAILYDREHTIGHAFFTGLAQDPSVENLAKIFSKSVIPLLQEYFYEDYQKIQLVLGDNAKADDNHKFIKDIQIKANKAFKGNVDDVVDLSDKKKYVINSDALMNIQSYIEIM